MRSELSFPRRSGSFGALGWVVAALITAGAAAAVHLQLGPSGLVPGPGGLRLAGEFFGRALRPALAFEGGGVTGTLLPQALRAAGMTVVFAAAAISLAIGGGLTLGFLGSSRWWSGPLGPVVTGAVRIAATLMRSIHELVWAVLLLAAFGTDPLVAVIAIAIPYTGVLAKVFAEMIDEAPVEAADALAAAGASPLQRFFAAQLPQAAPDMTAYTFYRFECALRSSAVLGFFGFPTLGYFIAASFENLLYGEVWTYLYVLFLLVLAVDWWSGRLRRELLR